MAKRTIKIHPTYAFRDQDPVVDLVRKVIKDNPKLKINEASDAARIARTTPKSWIDRSVLRPTHCKLAAFIGAYGKEFYIRDKR